MTRAEDADKDEVVGEAATDRAQEAPCLGAHAGYPEALEHYRGGAVRLVAGGLRPLLRPIW